MPRVITCSDSATITMQAHLHEGERENAVYIATRRSCVSCGVLQSEDMQTVPLIYAI
jgi:hypothetical protein